MHHFTQFVHKYFEICIVLLRTFLIKRHFAFKYMEEGNKEVHFKDLIHTAKSVEFKSLYIVSDVGALTNLMLPRL